MTDRYVRGVLLWVIGPAVLLTFLLVFQADSYQYWGDKYHSVLSSQYLFSRLDGASLVGPLWRDDLLAGNIWFVNLGTVPFMLDILLARLLHLSPVGIDLASNLLGYAVAVGAMYLYLRRVLGVSVESAGTTSIFFAASGYILSVWTGCANDFSTTGLLPALLLLAHRVKAAVEAGGGTRLVVPWAGLSLLTYAAAAASSLKTLPIMLGLVMAYAVFVFKAFRPIVLVVLGLALGLVLYSPWLWLFWDAARISQRVASTFVPAASYEASQFLSQALVVVRRVASGFNIYGVTMPVILVVLTSIAGYRVALRRACPSVRPIVVFSLVSFGVCFAMDVFAAQVNDLKRTVPLVNGFDVSRFQWFTSFFGLIPVAWLLDHGLGAPAASVDSPARARWARAAVVATAGLAAAQATHIAARTADVPAGIYPQNVLLCAYLLLFLVCSARVLILAYRAVGGWTGSARSWWFVLLALSVLFEASVLGYRHEVGSSARTAGDEPIMSYAERFAVPDDIALLKQVSDTGDRVMDLTRPHNRILVTSASTVLTLSGLRTLVGYVNVFPLWYDRFIAQGVNGVASSPSRWVEIKAGPEVSLAALQLLDVKYILAATGTDLPGYQPWRRHDRTGKVVYRAQAEVAPAFLSTEWRCMPSDGEALSTIHAADYATLIRRAILVATDADAQVLCNGAEAADGSTAALPARIGVTRGHDRVAVEVSSSAGGVLTLADTYYPGWHAFVDGGETPILRTYTTLRGVMVGPGSHTIEFVFAPRAFGVLSWLSNGLLLMLFLLMAWMTVRRRVPMADTQPDMRWVHEHR